MHHRELDPTPPADIAAFRVGTGSASPAVMEALAAATENERGPERREQIFCFKGQAAADPRSTMAYGAGPVERAVVGIQRLERAGEGSYAVIGPEGRGQFKPSSTLRQQAL